MDANAGDSYPSTTVLENTDLVAMILKWVEVTPLQFVRIGLVSKTWRSACRVDAALLIRAAKAPPFLTKCIFSGLFGLRSGEANQFPRRERGHRQGVMYMYRADAIDMVLPAIGGMHWWEERLARNAAYQRAREERFGPGVWCELSYSRGKCSKRARSW